MRINIWTSVVEWEYFSEIKSKYYVDLPTDFLNIPVDENVIVWSEIFNRCDKFFTLSKMWKISF